MKAFLAAVWALVLVAIGLFLATVADMFKDEIRARLRQLPHALIRAAALRVPKDLRRELGDEWHSELNAILDATKDVPVTGFMKAIWFALAC
jgi:hypothetical protein